MRTITLAVGCLVAAALAGGPAGAATAPTVHVTLIDPASTSSNVVAVNGSGTVIGTDDSGAFWYDRTGLHRLEPPAGSSGLLQPVAINDRGDILAQVTGVTDQVYRWRDGRWIFVADGDAAGLNQRGQVLVQVGTAAASFLLWRDGYATAINTPDVTGTPSLTGGWLNQAGQVAFSSRDAGTGNPIEAWLWTAGRYTRLPALVPGANAQVSGLNDLGEVIGQSGNSANSAGGYPVTWQHGTVHQLATPSTPGASVLGESVTGINDRGELVGTYSTTTAPPQQDVFWASTTAPATPLDPGAWATDPINHAGQVIFNVTVPEGIGQYHDEGFAWLNGRLADLGPAFPIAENQRGEVSMDSESSTGTFQAALATIDWGT